MAKFEITNPEAIKLINDIKSGVLFEPYLAKLRQYRWYLISVCLFLLLIVFIYLGKILYNSAEKPNYTIPKLDDTNVSVTPVIKSEYENIRQEILNYSTELPDPVIPPLDNNINLEVNQEEIQVW